MTTRTVLALAALMVLSAGCVRVYKASSLDKSFIKAREQTKGVVHKAFDDVKARREKLKGFKKTTPGYNEAVWQDMKVTTEKMASLGKEMSTYPGRIETLRNQLKLTLGKRTKVRSDQPRIWKQVEAMKAKLAALHIDFKALTGQYSDLNQTFRTLSKQLR